MLKHVLTAKAIAVFAAMAATPAHAIVMNDDDGVGLAAALGDPFDSVVTFDLRGVTPFCTGALISTTSVLTARHCFDGEAATDVTVQFTQGDGTILQERAVDSLVHLNSGAADYFDGSDLAILSFLAPILDFTPFRLVADLVVGEMVRMIGYGDQGLGSTGSTASYVGTRWGANNVLDNIEFHAAGFGNTLETDFDNPVGTSSTLPGSTEMVSGEGTTAAGDSGGPLLVRRGTEWALAGVLAGGTTADSVYGDVSIWTGVDSLQQRSFIEANSAAVYIAPVPLPAGLALLLAALGTLTALRARRPI